MKGGIYSRQRCSICGSLFIDTGKELTCPNHPEITTNRLYVKFGNVYHRFKSYDNASRFLTGLRFKSDEKTLDERDYRRDNPLGLISMSERYLTAIKSKTAKNNRSHIRHAQNYFHNRNVKELKCGDFEDFLNSLTLGDKTKHNINSTLHVFYKWMLRRQEIKEIPEFPVVSFVEGYRRTLDKETQRAIIEEIKQIAPLKVYLGIKWLAIYFSIRPAEMLNIKEGEIDTGNAQLYFPTPKEREFKGVPILPEDVEILKSFSLSVPAMPFFRHDGGIQGTIKDQPYGEKYFYKWWKRACDNLKIEGIDLYGGTTHSTVRALKRYYSPEQIKAASMRKTNKAFKHYLGLAEDDEILSIYKQASATQVLPFFKDTQKSN